MVATTVRGAFGAAALGTTLELGGQPDPEYGCSTEMFALSREDFRINRNCWLLLRRCCC